MTHKFDVPKVEEAIFDLVYAESALGMDHEKRQAKYQEARAPVKALRAELEEATTANERRKLLEKLRQAMKDSSRHLYAT